MHSTSLSSPPLQNSLLQKVYIALMQDREIWTQGLNQALETVLKQCCECMNVSRSSVWFFTADNQMTCNRLYDRRSQSFHSGKSFPTSALPLYYESIRSSRVLDADDTYTDPRTSELKNDYLVPMEITSMLDASINNEGRAEGVLCLEHTGPQRTWTDDEKSFVISISDLIAQIRIYYSLKDSESRYKVLFDQSVDAVLIVLNNVIVDCNETALSMFGCQRRSEMIGRHPGFFSPPTQQSGQPSFKLAQHYIEQAMKDEQPSFEWLHARLDGTPFFTRVKLSRMELQGKVHLIGTIQNIDAHHRAEKRILELNSLQKAIVEGAKYAIISTDNKGIIQSFNAAAEKLLGWESKELISNKNFSIFLKDKEISHQVTKLEKQLGIQIEHNNSEIFSLYTQYIKDDQEWIFTHKSGQEMPIMLSVARLKDSSGNASGFLGIAYDLTAQKETEKNLMAYQKELEYRANHDSLTGLPNRTQLHDNTTTAIATAQENQKIASMMLLDLDRFKEVNDTLGHHTGDKLLKALAKKLSNLLKPYNASLYRLGGDEFAVLYSNLTCQEEALTLATIITDSIRQPIEAEGVLLELAGSIGIALYPIHGTNTHDLLRCADVAMYRAKKQSSTVTVYDTSLDSHSPRRLKMMAELGCAIRANQLNLAFQPRIDIASGKCVGCEALIRWNHPELGIIPPDEFIHLAEMGETIHALSHWVIEHAIQQIKAWHSIGITIPVAINLSAKNLVDLNLPNSINDLLNQYEIEHHWLEVEITESAFISDPERAETVVSDIHKLGINMAIDDFGTGYSSLSYLKRLPIKTLKVDRSFVDEMLHDEQDAAIVHSTIGLAHSFGLTVIAEGVENQETLNALADLNCEHAQGFHICRPIPADEFTRWYTENMNSSAASTL